jgi:hypothetical protein
MATGALWGIPLPVGSRSGCSYLVSRPGYDDGAVTRP